MALRELGELGGHVRHFLCVWNNQLPPAPLCTQINLYKLQLNLSNICKPNKMLSRVQIFNSVLEFAFSSGQHFHASKRE